MDKSKSVEKREAIQKVDNKLSLTPTVIQLLDITSELVKRVAELEAKQQLISEGFQFVADETRGLFGLTPIALVFDVIAKKLR